MTWFKYLEIVRKKHLDPGEWGANSRWIKELNRKNTEFFFLLKGNAVVYLGFLRMGKRLSKHKNHEGNQRKISRVDCKSF